MLGTTARNSDAVPLPGEIEATTNVQRVEDLVRKEFGFVWRLARRFGLASADADDAAQQAMWIAARRIHELEPGKERAFLFTAIRYVAAKTRRTQGRRREELTDPNEADGVAPGDPEQHLSERQDRQRLDAILADMTEDLRTAFVLFEIEGLTQREIGTALEIPEGTVASRVRRAREEFKRIAIRHGVMPSSQGVTR